MLKKIIFFITIFSITIIANSSEKLKINQVSSTNIPEIIGYTLIKDNGKEITLKNKEKEINFKYNNVEYKKNILTTISKNKKDIIINKIKTYRLTENKYINILKSSKIQKIKSEYMPLANFLSSFFINIVTFFWTYVIF